MRLMLFIFVSYYVIVIALVALDTSAFISNNRKLAVGDVVAGYPSPRSEVQFTFQLFLYVCTCICYLSVRCAWTTARCFSRFV